VLADGRAFSVAVAVEAWRELVRRGQAGGHAERVAVVGSALRDAWLPPRVEQLHHVCAATERGDRQPAADDLAQGREVRRHAVQLLCPTWFDPGRDDLIEDQEDAE